MAHFTKKMMRKKQDYQQGCQENVRPQKDFKTQRYITKSKSKSSGVTCFECNKKEY